MSVQTSYDIDQVNGYAGGIFDADSPRDVISRAAEAVVAFGIVVSRGSDADQECLPGGVTPIGISLRSLEREGAASTGAVDYGLTETVAIMREGYVYAVCPTGCVPGAVVNYVEATGVLDSGAASGTGETSLDSCSWESTTAAGDVGVIRVRDVANITAGT